MIRKIIFLVAVLIYGSSWGQTSVDKYTSMYASQEKVTDFLSAYEVEIRDVRNLEEHKMNFQQFETSLNGYLELFYESSRPGMTPLTQVKPKKINIDLEFFNITEGSSSEAILKAIAFVRLDGGGYSKLKRSFNISAEDFSSIKLKNISKEKNAAEVQALVEDFSKRFAKKIVERIREETKHEEHLVYEITSIGSAVSTDDPAKTREKAVMLALVRASEIAFGTKVTNTSEIVDFGDVTDMVFSETGGTVLHHEVLEETVKKTDDGHYCLLVKSIIKKK